MADVPHRMVLIRAVPTGRRTSEQETRFGVTVAGVKLTVIESDSWEGGVPDEGVRQQYHRCTWLQLPEVNWNHG